MTVNKTLVYLQQAIESINNVVDELKIKIDSKKTLDADDIHVLNTLPVVLKEAKYTVLKLLNVAGFTQVEIAEKLGVTPSRVNQLLNTKPVEVSDLKYSDTTITRLIDGIKITQDSLTAFANEENACKILSDAIATQYRILVECLQQNGFSEKQCFEFLQASGIATPRLGVTI